MAFQIRIAPDALRAAAQAQNEVFEMVSVSVDSLHNARNILNDSWEGAAASDSISDLSSIIDGVAETRDSIQQLSTSISEFVGAFEALDQLIGFAGKMSKLFSMALRARPFDLISVLLGKKGAVRIIPENVRQAAAICQQEAERLAEANNQYMQILSGLANDWEGNAYTRYVEQGQEVGQSLLSLSDTLREFGDRLQRTANVFEELDASL